MKNPDLQTKISAEVTRSPAGHAKIACAEPEEPAKLHREGRTADVAVALEKRNLAKLHRAGAALHHLMSGAVRYNIQTVTTAIVASAATGICAFLNWPVWAMFLGWVASFSAGGSFKDVSRSYFCLALGIGIGSVGTIAVGVWTPFIGPLAQALAVLGMATIIVSMRKVPFLNIVPNYILGVLGIFALHTNLTAIALVQMTAPSAVGAIGVWTASRLQTKIANFRLARTTNPAT